MAHCTCCNLCFITMIVLSKQVNSKVLVIKDRININEDLLRQTSEIVFRVPSNGNERFLVESDLTVTSEE